MKIVVLGVSGMLGSAVFKELSSCEHFDVWGTVRSPTHVSIKDHAKIVSGVDVLDSDSIDRLMGTLLPTLVINCVGLVKQFAESNDPISVLPINAIFPHRLARLCEKHSSRLIHVSTDCVFSGETGGYMEVDTSDAQDLYGKSKFMGEVTDSPSVLTIRTSIIGHGLTPNNSLVDWFLSQKGCVKGFSKAIFSGLPTCELARIIANHIVPNANLSGLFHVSANPISKRDLLLLIAKVYELPIELEEDNTFVIDRSLNSDKFLAATGYNPPPWPALIHSMKESRHQ
jgi:dTDP-4-dehydrorhamnose reductase